MNFQVGDFLRFIRMGAKPNLYCVVMELLELEGQAKVYWLIPADSRESFIQAVDFKHCYSGIYEKVSQ